MKITNITNNFIKPCNVDIVLNINNSPKTFTLSPGQHMYFPGDYKSFITQTSRIQKQKGLIDFTDENEVVVDPSTGKLNIEYTLEGHIDNMSLNTPKNASEELVDNGVDLEEKKRLVVFQAPPKEYAGVIDLNFEVLRTEDLKKMDSSEVDNKPVKPKRPAGRPKGTYKLSSRLREASEKKSKNNDK